MAHPFPPAIWPLFVEFMELVALFASHRDWNMAPHVLTAVQFKYGGCTGSLCGLVCC